MQHAETNAHPLLRLLPVGGLAAVVFGLMTDVNHSSLVRASGTPEAFQGEINPEVIISREQLAMFLTISERDAKARVQEILQAPYCSLSNVEVRAGVQAERAVYPLAFDPNTWLVVLYEQEEYAGYQFRFVQ